MEIVGYVVSELVKPSLDLVIRLVKLEDNVRSLRREINDLKELRDTVNQRIVVAEEQEFLTRTPQVKGWLQQVETIEGEVNEIEEGFNQRRRCLGNCCPNYWSSYKLGKKVAKKRPDVADLIQKGNFPNVALRSRPAAVNQVSSSYTVGMASTLEKALNFLKEDEVGIVGIYGMGGVGKTTLLKEINNVFFHGPCEFDVVIWVVVSKNFNLGAIQKTIIERLRLSLPENGTLETNATYLLTALSKKNYLLLLDDVWKRLDLEMIGMPSPKNHKCKIAFTTRSMDVCSDMGADRKIEVEVLRDTEAWELFRKNVGGESVDSPSIKPIAENIKRKCGGLPLALIIIGRAMANKKSFEEWTYAETMLQKSLTELRGIEDGFLKLLKFSYEDLANDTLKLCFLYCSLFPEDSFIDTGSIIEHWIGEGFLDDCEDIYDARNKGYDIIGSLKAACLLESTSFEKKYVKMHDMIRELAIWIASESENKKGKFLVRAGVGLIEAPKVQMWKEAQRISLMDNHINALTETPTCPYLLTLMIQNNNYLTKVSNEFFGFMPHLRVLDLSYTNLKVLPADIGKLVELRYLNLCATEITTLPKEMGNMVELIYLNLSFTSNLKTIPPQVTAGNLKLRVFNLYASNYGDWSEISLAKLARWPSLNCLGITIKTTLTLNRFFESNMLAYRTEWLTIDGLNDLTSYHLSSTYQRMKHLLEFAMFSCIELEELIIGSNVEGENSLLSSLDCIHLQSLPKLKFIVVSPQIRFQNLHRLYIRHCYELKNIAWVLLLQGLESLELTDCYAMEEVAGSGVKAAGEELATLPMLKYVTIIRMPKLTSISWHASAFPCLKQLQVIECPNLKKLSLDPRNASRALEGIYGQKKWWDGLEWEGDTIKPLILPYFTPIG